MPPTPPTRHSLLLTRYAGVVTTKLPTTRATQFAAVSLFAVASLAIPALAQNTNNGFNSAIVAGVQNIIADGNNNFIGAGRFNTIRGTASGGNNISVIVAGYANTNLAARSVIVGGASNNISSNSRSSTITGGELNLIEAINPAIGSGVLVATIGGGQSNLVGSNAVGAVVGGGRFNEVSGPGATVPGGFANEASGTNSFAAGSRAVARNTGAFVWSDMSSTNSFISSRTNQFLIRATGGVGINTNDPGSNALLVNGSARVATNLSIGGNLTVSGTITGTISNLTASSLTTTNNTPIELKPGSTTGFTVTPQGTANLALTNPDVVTTYVGTGHNIIGGFNSHFVDSGVVGATIAGGGRLVVSNAVDGAYTNFNQVFDHFGTVSGGTGNSADGLMATVSGGSGNWAGGNWATIGGGLDNMIIDPTNIPSHALDISTIAGGFMNQILNAPGGSIGGGSANLITNTNVMTMETLVLPSTIAGGTRNVSTNASGGSIGGGYSNTVSGDFSTIPGGQENVTAGLGSFAAGMGARALHDGTFVWADDEFDSNGVVPFGSTDFGQFLIRAEGGVGINTNNPGTNALSIAGSTLITGNLNVSGAISGSLNASNATLGSLTVNGPILSGTRNTLTGSNGAIGGGLSNRVDNTTAAIAGGQNNTATGLQSFVGAGNNNTNLATYATIGGGSDNRIEGLAVAATIAGGQGNVARQYTASIGGGYFNTADGENSTVGGGISNVATANATSGTIGGGDFNTVDAPNATVPGGSENQASGRNSFAAGVRAKAMDDYSFVWGGSPAVDTFSSGAGSFTARAPSGIYLITSEVANVTTNNTNPVLGAYLPPRSTTWSALSDSNVKTDISAIDHRETLRKLAEMPVTTWRYKHDPARRYIGPMSQDFRTAFGLGLDDKTISTMDTDGVTLSAIKGLVEEIRQQDRVLAERESRINSLEQTVDELRERIENRSF